MVKKVLLIEDDPFLGSLLGNRLKRDGLEVVIAKNGGDAMKQIKADPPALILMDLILPGKSGFEIMEEIKADPQIPKIPIVIISNLGQEADIARGRELGAVEYIVKARTSIDELVSKIKSYLK